MQTNRFPFLFAAAFLLAAIASPLRSAEPSVAPPAPVAPPAAVRDLAVVEQFLNLSDTELEQMALAIERLRAMKPDERAALRQEIAKFRQLPEPQRQQLRQGWGWMPPEIQNGWREMMQSATPERRAEIQAKMQSLPPEQKTAYRRQLVEEYLKAKAGKK
jgi:hypothetical protein